MSLFLRYSLYIFFVRTFHDLIVIDVVHVTEASLPVEQTVGCARDYVVFAGAGAGIAVVELVPFVVGDGFGEGGVVAATHATKVVGHSKAVIDQLTLLPLLRTQDILTHVETR